MTNLDLSEQIRELIDTVDPVTADEAIVLASSHQATLPELAVALTVVPTARPPKWRRWGLAVTASAVAVAVALTAWLASASVRPGGTPTPALRAPARRVLLSAQEVSDITAKSASAMADSGTAEASEVMTRNGAVQSDISAAVTFEGPNLDEKMAVSSPAGAVGGANAFTVDDRVVDGQFYIYTPGPDDVTRWYHDAGQDNDNSLTFPDPRTLYPDISAAADFEVVGTTTLDGVTVTHLHAQDPQAINGAAVAGFTTGKVTAFDMWVDQNNVVRRLSLSSSDTARACQLTVGVGGGTTLTTQPGKKLTNVESLKPGQAISGTATQCGPQTTGESVTLDFAHLGAPESVVAPAGAIDFVGQG